MRIAPVGVLRPAGDLAALVDAVVEVSMPTHYTGLALAGAAAVAAAVSAGIDGDDWEHTVDLAVSAADAAARRGRWVAGADVAGRIDWVTGSPGRSASLALDEVSRLVGTSLASQESIPAAFAILSASPDDPWLACRRAASIGGDTDTIAAMVGAIGGARTGMAGLPKSAHEIVAQVNNLEIDVLAAGLVSLRSALS
jgi:ADP-ribosylglycohydrolase